jgi:hypothetical protein
MSNKLGLKKRREQALAELESDSNDSWATVELYRWQHGNLPGEPGTGQLKELSVPAGLRAMALAFSGPQDKWPAPLNVASVLVHAAKLIEKEAA